jgi:hypothetical protein
VRRLAAAALLLAGCAAPPDPRVAAPAITDSTLSVFEPVAGGGCAWWRVDPLGSSGEIARVAEPCAGLDVSWSDNGGAAVIEGRQYTWVTIAQRRAVSLPPIQGVQTRSFDLDGYPVAEVDTAPRPTSFAARIREWFVAPPPSSLGLLSMVRFDGREWAEWGGPFPPLTRDAFDLRKTTMWATPAGAPLERLLSQAVPHQADFVRFPTTPGQAFAELSGETITGPVVFLRNGDETEIAPHSPGESDRILGWARGPLLLVGATADQAHPRLYDASTGELLWSSETALGATFWPK